MIDIGTTNYDQSEAKLVVRNKKLWALPWVRQTGFMRCPHERSLPPGSLAWMRHRRGSNPDGLREFRCFVLHKNDFDPDSVYVQDGDCPIEAVLPLSLLPGEAPVPAWPVHQILSHLVAGGLEVSVDRADVRFRYSIPRHNTSEVRAILAALNTDEHKRATELWLRSFVFARDDDRWRWMAGGGLQREPQQTSSPDGGRSG